MMNKAVFMYRTFASGTCGLIPAYLKVFAWLCKALIPVSLRDSSQMDTSLRIGANVANVLKAILI